MIKPKNTIISSLISMILMVIICFCIYKIWEKNLQYEKEAKLHQKLIAEYKPQTILKQNATNESIVALKSKYPHVVGWLTLPNTKVDYPFVWSDSNEKYIHSDLDGNDLYAGTIFLDYRNHADLSDFHTILYGHNMKNNSMFGDLKKFKEQDFWDGNSSGWIILSDKTYRIDFVAFLITDAQNEIIYNLNIEKQEFLEYIKTQAIHYREVKISEKDRMITLSTCSYEFDDARMVLIGKIQ